MKKYKLRIKDFYKINSSGHYSHSMKHMINNNINNNYENEPRIRLSKILTTKKEYLNELSNKINILKPRLHNENTKTNFSKILLINFILSAMIICIVIFSFYEMIIKNQI